MNPFQQFNPATTQYHPANAYALGRSALLAYADAAAVVATASAWGFSRCRFIDRRETQLFVAGNATTLVVAFRGTEPRKLQDWMSDADIEKCAGPFGARVHSGFDRALGYVWDDLVATLREFQDNSQSLWITGHSLGAALAILATAYLRDSGRRAGDPVDKPVYGLYTFGSPRVGDHTFERAYDLDSASRSFRFVNNNDAVTRVPPRELDFSHVGKFLYFDATGKTLEVDPHWWYCFLEGVKGSIEDLGNLGPNALHDHSMQTYCERLQQHLNNNPF